MEAVKCEAFLAAAELGSLTATAELLGYTQSGVTRMIGTLEEELGFPLFLRSKKGVQLTENGKLMLPLLREVVRAHHNAEQLSAEIGGVSKGSLTIGCYYSISALWMPEILTAFRARYPGVTHLRCRLETGRTHQIRVHMKYIGHTLFNDERYGGHDILKGTTFTKYKQFVQNCFAICPRQALHAKTLGFVHPTTGEEMFFDSEIPSDMQQLIDRWRVYANTKEL